MNIILQNYSLVINNLIKNYFFEKINLVLSHFNDFSINNYINLLSSLEHNMNDFMIEAFISIIEVLDNNYKCSLERKRKYHIKY